MKSVYIQKSTRPIVTGTIQKLLLFCGILSSLWYIAINIIVPMHYPGYSMVDQTVSELSAINAPTRPLWVVLCAFYSFLVILFGWGLWQTGVNNRPLKTTGILFMFYGFSGFFWPPMHQREVLGQSGSSITDTMHIVFAIVTVVLMMLMIGLGAVALGKRFRIFSVVTLIVLIFFGMMTGQEGPHIAANLSTPYIGVWERINIGVFMLWVIVLAIVLLRNKNSVKPVVTKRLIEKEKV